MNAMQRCLDGGDVAGLRRLWRHLFPARPQPRNTHEAEVVMHHARTQAESVPLAKRLYSHAWLGDHGYPSGLPDNLRPEPRRSVIVSAVGITVRSKRDPEHAKAVEAAMADAVNECYADGITDPERVSARMWTVYRSMQR